MAELYLLLPLTKEAFEYLLKIGLTHVLSTELKFKKRWCRFIFNK